MWLTYFNLSYAGCGKITSHTIELDSHIENIGDNNTGARIYQPTILSIRGPLCRLRHSCWIDNNVQCNAIHLVSDFLSLK